jgi:hypothetical protein
MSLTDKKWDEIKTETILYWIGIDFVDKEQITIYKYCSSNFRFGFLNSSMHVYITCWLRLVVVVCFVFFCFCAFALVWEMDIMSIFKNFRKIYNDLWLVYVSDYDYWLLITVILITIAAVISLSIPLRFFLIILILYFKNSYIFCLRFIPPCCFCHYLPHSLSQFVTRFLALPLSEGFVQNGPFNPKRYANATPFSSKKWVCQFPFWDDKIKKSRLPIFPTIFFSVFRILNKKLRL